LPENALVRGSTMFLYTDKPYWNNRRQHQILALLFEIFNAMRRTQSYWVMNQKSDSNADKSALKNSNWKIL